MAQTTIQVRYRTRYARLCVWLAARVAPLSSRLACLILNCASIWVKVEGGPHPWRWQRVRLHAQYTKRETTEAHDGR